MKTNSFETKCFIFLLLVTNFFYGYLGGNGYILMIISFVPIIRKLFSRFSANVQVPTEWLLFLAVCVISLTFSKVKSSTGRFVFLMVSYFLVRIVLDKEYGWQEQFLKLVICFSAISMVAVLISPIFPNMMLSLAKILFKGDDLQVYMDLFKNESYGGIYPQTSNAAYFASIIMAYEISNLTNSKNKFLAYLVIVLSVITLLLTKKRSFLIANFLGIMILFWRNSISDKRKSSRILTFMFLGIVLYLVFRYSSATRGMFEKFSGLEYGGDVSNGRFDRWQDTLDIWIKHPIFGIGGAALTSGYGVSTHNVYLQILAELGIVGILGFLLLIIITLVKAFENYSLIINSDYFSKKGKSICGMAIYMQVVFLTYSFFGNPLYGISFMVPYVMFSAVLESYKNQLLLSEAGEKV